jgi:hypothetical protein
MNPIDDITKLKQMMHHYLLDAVIAEREARELYSLLWKEKGDKRMNDASIFLNKALYLESVIKEQTK